VQQGSLSMVDMAHYGDHWSAWLRDNGRGLPGLAQECFRVIQLRTLGDMAHFLDHDNCSVLIENLVDSHHRAELHARLDELRGLHRQLLREVCGSYRFGNQYLVNDRLSR